MQELNNDMDELLRRAAENYPLKTGNSNWNAVAEGLRMAEATPEPAARTDRRKFLWLLLLVPAIAIGYVYLYTGNAHTAAPQQTAAAQASQQPSVVPASSPAINTDNTSAATTAAPLEKQPVTQVVTPYVAHARTTSPVSSGNISSSSTDAPGIHSGTDAVSISNKKSAASNSSFSPPATQSVPVADPASTIDNGKAGASDAAANKAVAVSAPVQQTANPADTWMETEDKKNVAAAAAKRPAIKMKTSGWYVGLQLGPDISSVKGQAIETAGISGGFLLGYQMNAFGIESGITWDRKNYYSSGQYFSTKKLYLPPTTRITDLSGDCYMIEIPLNLSYRFASSAKNSWYASAGVSSYFMKNENYDYNYDTYGVQTAGYKTYKNSSNTLLAVVNLGVGFRHSIGKTTSLLVQPYFKLPLKGAGIGDLPITSSGISFGITKRIF